jgi:uncharacterized protein YndB with AHSA1/START domain
MKITVSTFVAAPIAEVWRAYNTPEDIKIWNTASIDWHTTAASVDLRVGGRFSSRMEAKDGSFGFDFAGEYTKIEPHKLIEYAFGDRVGRVTFSDSPAGVNVAVTFDSDPTHSEEQQRAGWQAILDNFARHVAARAQIKAAILNYVESWYEGDATRAERAVHPDLAKRIVEVAKNNREFLEHMGALELIQNTRSGSGKLTPASEQIKEIAILEVYANIATARVTAAKWVDFLHLANINGEWKIVNVLWAMKPQK